MNRRLPPVGPKLPTSPDDPRQLMRWIMFFTFLATLLVALIAGIVLSYQTKSPAPLALSGPFLLAMRPIINYLFSTKRKM